MNLPDVWAQAAAGGIVSAFTGMGAVIRALWVKVGEIEKRCAAEREDLTNRLIAEMKARVRDFNAPPPLRPTAPPAPDSERTENRKLRELVNETELDALLSDYTRSVRRRN